MTRESNRPAHHEPAEPDPNRKSNRPLASEPSPGERASNRPIIPPPGNPVQAKRPLRRWDPDR